MKDIAQPDYKETELKKFDINEAAIAEVKAKYADLSIKDFNDKEGYIAVSSARKDVKSMRVLVEKKRVELGSEALAFKKKIDSRAKELSKPLEELEDYLEGHEKAFEAEKERIKKEKEHQEAMVVQKRVNDLLAAGLVFNGVFYNFIPELGCEVVCTDLQIDVFTVKVLSDDNFEQFLTKAKNNIQFHNDFISEKNRLKEEEIARIDAERLAEAIRLESIAKEQAAEKERLEAMKLAQDAVAESQRVKEKEIQDELDKLEHEKLQQEQQKSRQLEIQKQSLSKSVIDQSDKEIIQPDMQDEKNSIDETSQKEKPNLDKEYILKLSAAVSTLVPEMNLDRYLTSNKAITIANKAYEMLIDVSAIIDYEAKNI